MLYDSHRQAATSAPTEWLPSGTANSSPARGAYRIFIVCLATSAQRVEQLVTRSLKATGADVQFRASPVAEARELARTRMVFAVRGSGNLRGAIAALINLLGADTCVRTVRWESNPQAA